MYMICETIYEKHLFKCGVLGFPRALSFLSHHDTKEENRAVCVTG